MNRENATIGKKYEDQVEAYLAARGYEPIGRNVRHESGVELDLHMQHRQTGQEIGVECKASEPVCNGKPGLERTDNVWKVLGYLHALKMWKEDTDGEIDYFVASTDVPKPGSKWHNLLERAQLRREVTIYQIPWDISGQD
jgi:Holliday junction resolvase-like predicted endonuclease